jgi:hypothetical protein
MICAFQRAASWSVTDGFRHFRSTSTGRHPTTPANPFHRSRAGRELQGRLPGGFRGTSDTLDSPRARASWGIIARLYKPTPRNRCGARRR